MKDGRIFSTIALFSRGRILERNWDKSLKSFPSCYSQSPLLTDFTSPTPWSEMVRNIVYGNLRTFKIMPRNLNVIVRSWIRLLAFSYIQIITRHSALGAIVLSPANHQQRLDLSDYCCFSVASALMNILMLLLLSWSYQLPSLLLRCCCVAYYSELLLLWYGAR
jgi:hypothetical protein